MCPSTPKLITRVAIAVVLGASIAPGCGEADSSTDQGHAGNDASLADAGNDTSSTGGLAGSSGQAGSAGLAGSSSEGGSPGQGGNETGGASGESGAAGSAGAAGTTGGSGAAGSAGDAGNAGSGAAGSAGDAGNAGSGAAGSAGDAGNAGSGAAGSAGDAGSAGSGAAGSAGDAGNAGSGAAGSAGDAGSAGSAGSSAGNAGYAGESGSAGAAGAAGQGGNAGAAGSAGGSGQGGSGGSEQPACATATPNAITGQRCPIFMPCTQSAQCGVFQGCQQWFCNSSSECELNALSSCWTDVGGACQADVVITQHVSPPVDKDFMAPDGVDFRELASLAITVKNNTATDLYLDQIPLQLDVLAGGSKYDVSSVKMYQDSGGTERGPGDMYVCLTGNPFSYPANGALSTCGGSSFSRIAKNGGSTRFIIELAFEANKTYIAGRSYRLRMASTSGIVFKVGYNGPAFTGTMCGIPSGGYVGAWLNAK